MVINRSISIRPVTTTALVMLPLSLMIAYLLLSMGSAFSEELIYLKQSMAKTAELQAVLWSLLAGGLVLTMFNLYHPAARFWLERMPAAGISMVLGTALLTFLWLYIDPIYNTNATPGALPELLAAGVTAILIAALICIEVSFVLLSRLTARAKTTELKKEAVDYRLMRPAIFVFLFGIDLSMAFIPLYMGKMEQDFFGLSQNIMMGLPISVEFFCVGVAILLAGVWFDRRGWQEPFYAGLALATLGALYSWMAPDALHFILSRGLVGLGYGLVQLSSHGFVIRNTDKSTKAQGMSHLAAGLYAGSLCGAATGAVMAEQFGYEVVFLSGAVIITSVVVYSLLILGYPAKTPSKTKSVPLQHVGKSVLRRFLLDKRVLAAIFFSSMPASIAVVGFLNYFSPVYLNRQGISESTIGQVLMLFGICIAVLAPRVGRLIDATENKQQLVLIGSLLGASAFLTFSIWDGLLATTIAIFLLGLSNCLVLSAQSVFLLKLDITQELGEGKAMGIFRASSRIGQMLGPIIFAWLFLFEDVSIGITYLGLAYIVMSLIFIWLTRSDADQLKKIQEGTS
ncbi:transporter major facilitator superfamily MFS_1 [Psychromonas ingrahamii 37]|uniref:Transporter major facilitator superfamily MFS_1 n=1 Tax=Psychromonas ingrahamii (strain DSM 17664 / CCUG 51855 / 37) TaxID=357804 RepID=A1SZV5_PSYIN|nr:MFS transporter [Psychromonas ingrahamii]ABM05020.1 transporter major facilitator superfamily MFS_1 [Psychromonas ingrahamii 37]